MPPDFLPGLIRLNDHGGNWEAYLDAIHQVFERDFGSGGLTYEGKRVGLKRHPISEGKSATFWHFVSEGKVEANRVPDLRRCERIGWPKPAIVNCADASFKIWSEERGSDTRVHLWCESADYLVVLADRGDYVLPWTAYVVDREHEKRKLEGRFQRATNG